MLVVRPRLCAFLFSVLFILLGGSAAFSQTPQMSPTPSPTPGADDDVVRISTSLVQIDVTAVDQKGKVVSDLKRDEIEIYENGVKQNVTSFSFVTSVTQRSDTERQKAAAAAPDLPPVQLKPDQIHRTIALVVDDLRMSFESVYYTRRALKNFVDNEMQPGDLVAIIRTGAGIGALQQFTSDKRLLYAAIEKIRWNAVGGQIGAFAPLEAKEDTPVDSDAEPDDDQTAADAAEVKRENDEFRESIFATGTLGAVKYIVGGMKELPGRKSILLLSDGFSITEQDAGGTPSTGRVFDALTRLIDEANRAAVVIYTLDPRGLKVTALTAEDDASGRTGEELSQAVSDRNEQLADTQDGLRFLARQTGGIAIVNNNSLAAGIRKILDDQSYYLVGYEPDSETFDPKTRRFNKITVKVTRPGVKVRYRSGFFSVPEKETAADAGNEPGATRLYKALFSPFAVNDIPLRLNALFASDAKSGAFIRSLTHIPPGEIVFKTLADGSRQAVFDIVAVTVGDNGQPIDKVAKTYTMTLKPDVYKRFLDRGIVYDLNVPVKKPGAYQLRIALHDQGSDKVGSANQFIEIPDLKKGRLTLSGIVLRSVTLDEYNRRGAIGAAASGVNGGDPLADTSVRQFRSGTVLDYAVAIYNARAAASGKTLSAKVRIYRDSKMIFDGADRSVPAAGSSEASALEFAGSLSLGKVLAPGDYILEIVVTDPSKSAKHNTAREYVQFEIIP